MLPNVSICADEPGVVYFNPAPVGPTYESVDLGLPSGKKWAKCNIGAETETDYGKYFMWGDTTGCDANTPDGEYPCDWAHAPFNNGQSSFDETYFNAHKSEWLDANDNLKPEYDAARANIGGDWRMPAKADWNELLSGTTNEWVTNYNGSGVNGRLFTSKTNSNTLFIPAAGYRDGSSFSNRGDFGSIWSSSLGMGYPNLAWGLVFFSVYYDVNSDYDRCYGFSVRGVL